MPKIPYTLKRLIIDNILPGPKPGTKKSLSVKEQEEKKEKDDREMIKRILRLGKEEDNFDKVIKNITELFFSYSLSNKNLIYLLKRLKQGEIYNLKKYIETTRGIEKKREFEQAIQSIYPKYYKTISLTKSEYEQFSHPYKYVDGIKEDEDPHERYTSADDDGEYNTEEESTTISDSLVRKFINAADFNRDADKDTREMPDKFDVDEGKYKPLHYDAEPLTVDTVYNHKKSRKKYKHSFFEKGGKRNKYNKKRRTRRKK
jgi:hypothetical protein